MRKVPPEAETGEAFGKWYPRSLLMTGVLAPSAAWLTPDPHGRAVDYFPSQPSCQQRFRGVVLIQKFLKRKKRNVYLGFRQGLQGVSTNLEGLLAKLYVH